MQVFSFNFDSNKWSTMKILSASQIRIADNLSMESEPISSINLMERASLRFTQWFTGRFDSTCPVVVFAGAGNNGGDALAVSRMLIERQFRVRVYLVKSSDSLSVDCSINFERLKNYSVPLIVDSGDEGLFPEFSSEDIIIDGIFGTGLNRPVEGFVASLIRHINKKASCVVSIDIPSGLFGEDNRLNNPESIIRAHYTGRFETPLLSFFISGNEKYTGQWEIIPIGIQSNILDSFESNYSTIESDTVRKLIIPRNKYSHKGTYGHALLIAGHYGMMGAAVLCARACLRGGVGLVTSCVPRLGCEIIQTSVPEALVLIDKSDEAFSEVPELDSFQAIGCGPGIGQSDPTAAVLHQLILASKVPLVLDADALNILAEHKEWLEHLPKGTVITPHPREFDRLAGDSEDMYSRHLKQIEFAGRFNIIVVLKGANTIISTPGGKSYINTTGNPGMATGGTGDVLTGLLVSLLAQGYTSLNASIVAVFIHGLAGDLALESSSMEAILAGDVIEHLGHAFHGIKASG
jgi:NAD(P)H-hydrate epimerase